MSRNTIILFFFLISLSPSLTHAWEETDHQALAKAALVKVADSLNLNTPVEPRPIRHLIHKLASFTQETPHLRQFRSFLKINPTASFTIDTEPMTPLDILSKYSSEPDDGRDKNLFTVQNGKKRPYSWQQYMMGGVTGNSSQGFRHLEKPPFDLYRPQTTFGIPPSELGEASRRAQLYFDLAVIAYTLEEPYWAWRFLAHALHYLQDLTNPYHTIQMTPRLFLFGLQGYWEWGRHRLGLIQSFTRVASNTHRFFEAYVSTQGLTAAAEGSSSEETILSVRDYAHKIRDHSNRKVLHAIDLTISLTDRRLIVERRLSYPGDDLTVYLVPDLEKVQETTAELQGFASECFKDAGHMTRTFVTHFSKTISEEVSIPERLKSIQQLR